MADFIQKFLTGRQNYGNGETRVGELGRLWYDSITNTIRIGDGTVGGRSVGGNVHEGEYPPNDPTGGDMWWYTIDGRLYIYYDEQWIDASPPVTTPRSFYTGNLILTSVTTPITSKGSAGDLGGMFIVDDNYLYHCSGDYDGTTDIWRRLAWPGDTW